MSPDQFLGVLWQRRWLFAATTAGYLAVVVVVAPRLFQTASAPRPPADRAVPENGNESLALDTGVGEQLARTYTALAAQPSVADQVVRDLGSSTNARSCWRR